MTEGQTDITKLKVAFCSVILQTPLQKLYGVNHVIRITRILNLSSNIIVTESRKKKTGWVSYVARTRMEKTLHITLKFWRRNFLLNFSTPCISNVNITGTKKGRNMK
jgi:hypothetical protein